MRFPLPFLVYGLLLLVVGGAGACQRASYPSGSSAATAYKQRTCSPLADSQMTALVVAARPLVPVRRELPMALRTRRRPVAGAAQVYKVKQFQRLLMPHLQAVNTPKAARQQAYRAPLPPDQPVRYRSRAVAILLAVLAITYLPLSLHNFYLGYYGRGALAIGLVIVGINLVVVGFLANLFSGGGVLLVGVVGLAMLSGWFIWQLSDLVRIITRDLKPKDGEYR